MVVGRLKVSGSIWDGVGCGSGWFVVVDVMVVVDVIVGVVVLSGL